MSLTEKSFFDALADAVCTPVDGAERVTLNLKAETSDFIRFNRAAVRQATHVRQRLQAAPLFRHVANVG